MQFSKSAGKHWTELSGSLSPLFFYFPTSRPVSSLSLHLSRPSSRHPLSSAIDEFSLGAEAALSPHFRRWLWDTRANLYLLFRRNLRHTAIRRIFWSNCSPREKRSFVKYASHSSDCNRRMRNACESIPLPRIPLFIEWNVEIPTFLSCLPLISPPITVRSGKRWSLLILELIRD